MKPKLKSVTHPHTHTHTVRNDRQYDAVHSVVSKPFVALVQFPECLTIFLVLYPPSLDS